MRHFHTNLSCANDSNAIVSTGCKTGSLGFFQGFAVIYVTILTFVSLSHCIETKIFQQFHKTTAPLQAQCNERHSRACLGKLNRQRQSRNLGAPQGKSNPKFIKPTLVFLPSSTLNSLSEQLYHEADDHEEPRLKPLPSPVQGSAISWGIFPFIVILDLWMLQKNGISLKEFVWDEKVTIHLKFLK